MNKKLVTFSIIAAVSILFSACGTSTDDITTFKSSISDSKIEGLTYTCGTTTGTTNKDGIFKYTSDCSVVEFSIGSIKIGSINTNNINGQSTIYPSDLLGLDRNDTNNTQLINILQVLQSLDNDGNPNNGILIDSNTTNNLTGISPIDLDSNETNSSDISTIIENTTGKTLIKQDYAIAHYEETLRKDLNMTIDTVPPAPALFAQIPSPTNKNITSISINGESGAKIFINGLDTNLSIDNNNTAIIDLNTIGDDGYITSIITLQDDLNQTSDDFNATILKDTIAPNTASSTLIPDYINIATINKDKISTTISGEDNASVFVDGTNVGTITNGTINIDLNTSGADGVKSFNIVLKDLAGNESSPLNLSTIKDTIAPNTASSTSIDAYTNLNNLSTTISGEDNASVFVNGILVGTITNGTLNINLNTSGADGVKLFNIVLKDLAGNESSPLNLSTIKDTIAPNIPTVTTQAKLDNGNLVTTINGEKNSIILINNIQYGTISSNSQIIKISNPNNSYYETFIISLKDLAGNISQSFKLITTFSRTSIDNNTTYYIPQNNTVLKDSTTGEELVIMSYEDNQSVTSSILSTNFTTSETVNTKLSSLVTTISNVSNINSIKKITEELISNNELLAEYTINTTTNTNLVDLISQIVNNIYGNTLTNLPIANSNAITSNYFNLILKLIKSDTGNSYIAISLVPNSLFTNYQTTISSVTNTNNISTNTDIKYSQTDELNATTQFADFLFVIDDSGSMSSYQNAVSQAATDFGNAIENAGINFRIAIITTGTNIDNNTSTYTRYYAAGILNDIGLIENNISLFKNKIVVGTSGSATETAIYNAEKALQSKVWGDTNDGVVTQHGMPADKNTSLSVIILSDEKSQYYSRANESFDIDNNLFTQRGYTVYSIIKPSQDSVSQYDDLAIKTNGLTADISNTSNYDIIMNSIAKKAAATVGYKLSKNNVVESSIYVTVNNQEVQHDNLNGWRFSEAYNSVIFEGSSIPAKDSNISITYTYSNN